MSKDLQSKLNQARAKLKMTQEEFAKHISVSVRTLQKWEQDNRTPRGFALSALEEKLTAILKKGKK